MQKEKPVSGIKSRLMGVFGAMLALAIIILPSPAAAAADAYPAKPTRILIAFAPGGSTDIIGRLIAQKLSERLGKQVVPENRSGGGGTIGMEAVAKADPDGYTLLFTSAALAINPLLYKVPYDPVKSFVPIAMMGSGPVVLTVHPSVPANSVKELIALAKKQPGKMVSAAADSYPVKPTRLIIAFAPGGSTDIIGRLIAQKLSERLGKQVVPENRAGGGGTIGAEMVAKSDPDGYTLLFTSAAIAINPLLFKVPYDTEKSFVPVAMMGNGPVVLTVHPGVQANSVKELIALAKKQPGKLVSAAAGVGSFMHLATELFKMMAGIDFKIVQFKGGGPAMIDTMGGHSQISLGTLTQSLPQIKSGKLKALGFGGSTRSKLLPDLPTVSEAGLPGYEASQWWGLLAPAGTPKPVIDRLHKELTVILNAEDTKKTFEAQGAEADWLGPAEFTKFIATETAKWGKVIKEGNIRAPEQK